MTTLAWAMLYSFLFVVVGNLIHALREAYLRKKARRETHLNLLDTDQTVPALNEKLRQYLERTLTLEGVFDADQLDEIAYDLGLTEHIVATKPCGEHCLCERVGFPVVCRRLKNIEEDD